MKHLFWVFVGGGIGSAGRYWLSGLVYRFLPGTFPFGTMLVNTLGSVLIGVAMALLGERVAASPAVRVFLTIGVLGGFTTFSTFSYETVAMLRDAQYGAAIFNVLVTLTVCLGGTLLGLEIGRRF